MGGLSDLERFVLAVTAMRWSGNERSLANAILRVVSQPLAPDLQASARGTRWSTSRSEDSVISTPS